jgi:hypothetical protein
MPLPSDAARVSLLAESSEDESSEATEISAPPVSSDDPGRKANPLAHAPDAELDALVRSLRSKKPSDRTKLEAEEREAARARVRVELMSHVHRMKRGGVVAFPADFDADAAANAEAQRAVRRGPRAGEVHSKGEPPVPFDPNLAARMRRELRETGTVSVGPAVEDHDADADADAYADADADADADAGDLRDLDGSFERFRVTVDELVRVREDDVKRVPMMPHENESDATARTDAGPETSTECRETEGEQKDAREKTEDFSFFDARSSLALAAIDAKLAAAGLADSFANTKEERHEKPTRARALREETTEETTPEPDLSNDAVREDPNELDSVEPFGGDDAAKKLASVDARLKTFATRRG